MFLVVYPYMLIAKFYFLNVDTTLLCLFRSPIHSNSCHKYVVIVVDFCAGSKHPNSPITIRMYFVLNWCVFVLEGCHILAFSFHFSACFRDSHSDI